MTAPAARKPQRLERRVHQQVVERRVPPAAGQRADHVGELADGRVREDALDVVLRQRGQRRAQHGDRGDDAEHRERRRRRQEHRVEPRHREHPGGDHRRGVDQRRDRRRAGHRVRQPDVQRELRGLADDAGAEQQRGGGHRPGGQVRHGGEHVGDAEAAGGPAEHDHPDDEAGVPEPGGQERLERGRPRLRQLTVVTDQDVRAQAHDLPADQQHDEVAGDDDEQHGRREQRHERRVGRVARVAAQVLDRVELHEQRHRTDHDRHDHGQPVQRGREVDRRAPGLHGRQVRGRRRQPRRADAGRDRREQRRSAADDGEHRRRTRPASQHREAQHGDDQRTGGQPEPGHGADPAVSPISVSSSTAMDARVR